MLSMITVELLGVCTKKLAFTEQGNCNLNRKKTNKQRFKLQDRKKNFLNTSFPFNCVISINLIKILQWN